MAFLIDECPGTHPVLPTPRGDGSLGGVEVCLGEIVVHSDEGKDEFEHPGGRPRRHGGGPSFGRCYLMEEASIPCRPADGKTRLVPTRSWYPVAV